jgi:glycosyltransferase involved in cell wall biosynthesis
MARPYLDRSIRRPTGRHEGAFRRQKIYINGRFLLQPLSGVQRYAEQLITALDDSLSDDERLAARLELVAFVPPGTRRPVSWQHTQIREIGRLRGHAWEQIELGWHARDGILVSLGGSGPLAHTRQVVALHDASIFAHPEHFSRTYGVFHRLLRPRLARSAFRLVTISEFSRTELARYCGVPPDRFTLIGNSPEHIAQVKSDEGILSRFGLEPGRYLLCVGNQSPNKNIALAIHAFQASRAAVSNRYLLAVAGGGSEAVFGETVESSGDGVRRLGRVSDAELRALYERAALFVFPSRYEGFGVPPLEAMALGCPVVSSDSSAMPSVLGDAAAFFRSDDAGHLASMLDEVLSNGEMRRALVERGHERVRRYAWSEGARILVNILEQCAQVPRDHAP